jgi:hypothetical protein
MGQVPDLRQPDEGLARAGDALGAREPGPERPEKSGSLKRDRPHQGRAGAGRLTRAHPERLPSWSGVEPWASTRKAKSWSRRSGGTAWTKALEQHMERLDKGDDRFDRLEAEAQLEHGEITQPH